ncbi:MAG TPA: serine/threonine protein phosphatase, partial [Ruminococcaceae bacterium]|nr:serine/threonine protein phosphatase [Oscillospiraceae bacterium]
MGFLFPKSKNITRAAVQTASQPQPEGWQPQRFLPAEAPLYHALRQSIPIIDAALQKIVRLTVDFTVTAADPR